MRRRRKAPRPPAAEALTLVEALVVLALFTVVAAVAHQALVEGRLAQSHLRSGLDAEQDGRLKLLRISREVQEATRIFYPVRYGRTVTALGFLGAAGDPVLYWTQPPDAAADITLSAAPSAHATPPGTETPGVLLRCNLNTGVIEQLLEGVDAFRATVHPSPPGKEPSCVTLYLAVAEAGRPRTGDRRSHAQLTRVFLRNLERPHPDD